MPENRKTKGKTVKHEVMVIAIIVGALGMVPKRLEKRLAELEIRRRIETIQSSTLLRPARKLRNDLRKIGVHQIPMENRQ